MKELKFNKWMKVLSFLPEFLELDPTPAISSIYKYMDISFSHIYPILRLFEIEGIITTKRWGRIIEISLTEKGKLMSKNIKDIMDIMEKNEKTEAINT